MEKLSQYDLGKRGFTLIEDDPESFQLLDGDNQPQNVVKSILEKLHDAAENDPLFAHALARHQYQQLLDIIDANRDGKYSTEEYHRAVQNPEELVYVRKTYHLPGNIIFFCIGTWTRKNCPSALLELRLIAAFILRKKITKTIHSDYI